MEDQHVVISSGEATNAQGFDIRLDDNIDLMTHSIKSPKEKTASRIGSLLDQIVNVLEEGPKHMGT